jgi:hypothetical protein
MIVPLVVLAFPRAACADAGIPMLMLVWPGFIVLLAPIIIIEAWCFRRILRTRWKEALVVATRANLVSTLVGIPLTWLVMFFIQLGFELGADGLSVDRSRVFNALYPFVAVAWVAGEGQSIWEIFLAVSLLSVVFYFVSVVVERRVAAHWCPTVDVLEIRRWSWQANTISYGTIILGLVSATIWLSFHTGR